MEEHAHTQSDFDSTSRWTLRNELFGPPRLSRSAQFSVACFGLLLVASLAVPSFSEADASPGLTMMLSGLMVMCGFAELLDPRQRRFVVALRFTGAGTALLGLLFRCSDSNPTGQAQVLDTVRWCFFTRVLEAFGEPPTCGTQRRRDVARRRPRLSH